MGKTGPSSMTLPNLAKAASKNYGLPLFQRELKWSWEHQQDLLISIMKGIPIGTILLWKYDSVASEEAINMRPINQIEKEDDDIKILVLDGQQRVTFLTWLWKSSKEEKFADILGKHSKKEGGYIYLHLDEDAGKPKQKSDETDEQYEKRVGKKKYGMFSIGKKQKDIDTEENLVLVQYLLEDGIAKKDIEAKFKNHPNKSWIGDLYDGLLTTSVNTFLLGSNVGYGDALLIYERVNVAGTKLQGRDVTEAVFISRWKELYTKLATAEEKLSRGTKKQSDFKSIFQRKRIMNCMTDDIYNTISAKPKAMKIFEPTDLDGNDLSKTIVSKSFKRVEKSLFRVKKLLKEYFEVVDDKEIGTDWPVVIASAYIRTHYPGDSEMGENKGKLAKWMALAILRKHYTGGSTNTKVEDDLKAVKNSNSPWLQLYENMSKELEDLNATECKKIQIRDLGNHDSSKTPPSMSKSWIGTLYKAALYRYNAKDPHTLDLIKNEEDLQWHHIFPKAMFDETSKHYAGSEFKKKNLKLRDYPSNLSLISKGTNLRIRAAWPEKYLNPICTSQPEIADIHQWNNPGFTKVKDFRRFVNRRQNEMMKFINRFLDDISGNVEPPTPTAIPDHKNRIKGVVEGQVVEYKATLRVHTQGENVGKIDKSLEQVAMKEICALMNDGGGWLYIGVTENEILVKGKKKKTYEVTGIEEDLRSLDSPKKGKEGNWEFLEAHLRRRITNHIIIPDDLKFKLGDLLIVDEVQYEKKGMSVMAIRVFPWSQRNAAFRESNKSDVAVEWGRKGGSKQPRGKDGTWHRYEIEHDGKQKKYEWKK